MRHMALPLVHDIEPFSAQDAFIRAEIAEQVRSVMGRKRVTGAELARRLHKSEAWVSRRTTLAPEQAIDLVELGRIAGALGVTLRELIPDSICCWFYDAHPLTSADEVLGQMVLALDSERPALSLVPDLEPALVLCPT
jgi:transcriptional regulator with XRE-family HTH domain